MLSDAIFVLIVFVVVVVIILVLYIYDKEKAQTLHKALIGLSLVPSVTALMF